MKILFICRSPMAEITSGAVSDEEHGKPLYPPAAKDCSGNCENKPF